MTVRDNLGFALKVRKVPKAEREKRVAAVAAMLGLGELLDRRPRQLSGGQRQRVAMGRAIVRHPKAFLFDEPLSNLDAALRSQMRVELKLLHERLKATMVYVTHDQVEAMTLADRIAVLHKGTLMQVGSPADLYERPARKFVATFLGSPAMNILSAVARDGHAEGDGFSVEIPPTSSGRALLVGIRPHDVRLEGGSLAAEVQVVEPVGREAYVHLRLGSATVVASCEVDRLAAVRSGAKLSIGFAPDRVHLFDAKTEERL
jgi:multiple sugar transport system ATP-binding protein